MSPAPGVPIPPTATPAAAQPFPLAEPTKLDDLAAQGVTGEESLAERTTRNVAERQAAAAAKVAQETQPDRFQVARDRQQAEQYALEEKYGRADTFAAQFSLNAMGLLTSPAALGGLGLESLGELTDSQTLHDLGRDIGMAATGRNALGSMQALQAKLFGGDPAEAYDAEQRYLDESDKAWPLLAAVSRGIGTLGGALATGGASALAKAPGVLGKAAVGAVEGAAAGAQQGYENNLPLRDILASTAIGGALGGATAGALAKGEQFLSSDATREFFEKTADQRVGKAIGLTKSQITKMGEDAAEKLGRDVAGYTLESGEKVFPDDLVGSLTQGRSTIADRIAQGREEVGAKIGDIRRTADQYIESEAPDLRPNAAELVKKMQVDIDKLEAEPILRSKVGPLKRVVESIESKANEDGTISVSSLLQSQKALKGIYKDFTPEVLASKTELKSLERMIDAEVTGAVDRVAPKLGSETAAEYTKLKGLYGSFADADDAAQKAITGGHGNNFFSLTSQMAGLAEFAHAGEGGLGAAGLKGLAAAAAHKYLRGQGSTILAYGARKLAGLPYEELAELSAPVGISVAQAGGREAKEVVDYFARTQRAIADAADAAGPNPDLRMAAQQEEHQRRAAELTQKVGDFDPAQWHDSPPTPLQKVVFRGPILDAVSHDIAGHVQNAAQLAPDADMAIDPSRIRRLASDANGQAAIGRMQSLVNDILHNAPPTLFGDQIQAFASNARQRLSFSDVADSFSTGHELASHLRSFAAQARDDVTREFALRQSHELHDALTSDDYGSAGALYDQAYPDMPDKFAELADPAAVREALRTASSRGDLPDIVREFADQTMAAVDARAKLSGTKPDRSAQTALRDLEKRISKAEAAVTLDGGPIGRIVDHLQGTEASRQSSPDDIVLHTLSDQMKHVMPQLKPDADGAAAGRPPAKTQRLPAEEMQLYRERLDTLTSATADPATANIGAGLAANEKLPPDLVTLAGSDAQQRLQTLLQDMPKVTPNVRGKAFESLSLSDLRLADAMWEATTKPLSVFEDFARGTVDYDKVQYAWKQYPGLQQAAQTALLDVLHAQLSEDERAAIPDGMLTQQDYLFGFGGRLQGSVDAEFSARMTAIGAQAAQPQPPKAPLSLNLAKPTYTQRLMGQK